MKHESIPAPLGRLLGIADVARETSLSRTQIYRLIADGAFPRQIRLTARRVAWAETDVERWKNQHLNTPTAEFSGV